MTSVNEHRRRARNAADDIRSSFSPVPTKRVHPHIERTAQVEMNVALRERDDDAGPAELIIYRSMELVRNYESPHGIIDKHPQFEVEAVVAESQKKRRRLGIAQHFRIVFGNFVQEFFGQGGIRR